MRVLENAKNFVTFLVKLNQWLAAVAAKTPKVRNCQRCSDHGFEYFIRKLYRFIPKMESDLYRCMSDSNVVFW